MSRAQELKQQAMDLWEEGVAAEREEMEENAERLNALGRSLMRDRGAINIPIIPAYQALMEMRDKGYQVPELHKDGVLVPEPLPFRKGVTHGYPRLTELPEGFKQCSRCGMVLSLLNFNPDSRDAGKPNSHCKFCAQEATVRSKCRRTGTNYVCTSIYPAVKAVWKAESAEDYNNNLEDQPPLIMEHLGS